jgi:hypothetical protein
MTPIIKGPAGLEDTGLEEDAMKTTRKKGPGQAAKDLIKAAEQSFAQGLLRAAGFGDAEEFKHSLIEALHQSPAFARAARELHGPLVRAVQAKGKLSQGGTGSQVARAVRPQGRVQAAHRDPSLGQRDRHRGFRLKGGKRNIKQP